LARDTGVQLELESSLLNQNKNKNKFVLSAKSREQKELQKEFGNVQNAEKNLRQELIIFKMANYKCFKCGKKIKNKELEKRFVCVNCGSRIFYKPREKVKVVKAI